MANTNKLYRVTLRGLSSYTGLQLKVSYVVARNSDEAYQKVRTWLDQNSYGLSQDRVLEAIELLAEDYQYTDVRTRLFL